jgi:hypothetical protein
MRISIYNKNIIIMKTTKIFATICIIASVIFLGHLFVANVMYWGALITFGVLLGIFGCIFLCDKNLKK